MNKVQLRMANNELEAKNIELGVQLACKEQEADVMCIKCEELEDELQVVQDRVVQDRYEELARRPVMPFAEWYYTIHPVPGGNPDLKAIEATQHARIIA